MTCRAQCHCANAHFTGYDEKLDYFLTMKEGWDSYGAEPLAPNAVAVVRRLLASASIVPRNDGGIELGLGSESVLIGVSSDGRLDGISYDRDEWPGPALEEM